MLCDNIGQLASCRMICLLQAGIQLPLRQPSDALSREQLDQIGGLERLGGLVGTMRLAIKALRLLTAADLLS